MGPFPRSPKSSSPALTPPPSIGSSTGSALAPAQHARLKAARFAGADVRAAFAQVLCPHAVRIGQLLLFGGGPRRGHPVPAEGHEANALHVLHPHALGTRGLCSSLGMAAGLRVRADAFRPFQIRGGVGQALSNLPAALLGKWGGGTGGFCFGGGVRDTPKSTACCRNASTGRWVARRMLAAYSRPQRERPLSGQCSRSQVRGTRGAGSGCGRVFIVAGGGPLCYLCDLVTSFLPSPICVRMPGDSLVKRDSLQQG